MEIFLIIMAIFAVVGPASAIAVNKWAAFTSGRMQIDPLKHPTLHRAQRILRNNNVKARELEASNLSSRHKYQLAQTETTVKKAIENKIAETNYKHKNELDDWDRQFSAVDFEKRQAEIRARYEEEQRIERAHAAAVQAEIEARREEQRKQVQAAAEQRQRELAQWTATEIARQKMKSGETPSKQQYVKKLSKAELDEGYSSRSVNVHLANIRKSPSDKAAKVGVLEMGDKVIVSHWAFGTTLYENNIWFKVEGTSKMESGWIWSGCLDSLSTAGVRRHYVEEKKNADQEHTDKLFNKIKAEFIL